MTRRILYIKSASCGFAAYTRYSRSTCGQVSIRLTNDTILIKCQHIINAARIDLSEKSKAELQGIASAYSLQIWHAPSVLTTLALG